MRVWIFAAALLALSASVSSRQPASRTDAAPPDTDIFLATLTVEDGTITVGKPENMTKSPGYDNQPAFTPEGDAVLFTSVRGGKQTDIYRYDLATPETTPVTN